MHDLTTSDKKFLAAKTRWDDSSDWDSLVPSAAAGASILDASRMGNLNPGVRHQIKDICDLLKKVLASRDKYLKFISCRQDAAQDLLDILQKLLDHAPLDAQFRPLLYVALVRLCRKSKLCPQSFILKGVTDKDKETLSPGTFGDVYTARYEGSNVCVKSVKVYRERDSRESFEQRKDLARKAFAREAVIWGQLSHANVLPFYGTCQLKEKLYLVSPLVPNGDVNEYLLNRPEANRPRLIYGVAAGMEYLHQNGVAHGDLKCANVLVAGEEQALLTDFGFSYVTDYNDKALNLSTLSSNHARGGTLVFEAPERLNNDSRRDGKSDVFAFGMLCYEMFDIPVGEAATIDKVHRDIVNHSKLPQQPRHRDYLLRGLTDDMWAIMKKCWSHEPIDRPTATEIKQQLPSISPRDQTHFREIKRPGFQSADALVTRALEYLQAL